MKITDLEHGNWYKVIYENSTPNNNILQYKIGNGSAKGYWRGIWGNWIFDTSGAWEFETASYEDLENLGQQHRKYYEQSKSALKTEEPKSMRHFSTGATRNLSDDKLDFNGFLSPLALEEFAKYMHKNRIQADGKMRDSDNWQKGIPTDAYMSSMWRHFFDTWKSHRGLQTPEDQISNLCGLLFNVQGMLHELLKTK